MTYEADAPQVRMWRMVIYGTIVVIALATLFVAVAG